MYVTNPKVTDRFWSKVLRLGPDDCWEWQAYCDKVAGYGRFGTRYPEVVWAHRYAYFITEGRIPDGLSVLHECDNRKCCNPKHLFAGTHQDNMQDMAEKGRAGSRGERSWNAKLTEDHVREIRQLFQGGMAANDIADVYGIHPGHTRSIIRKKFWKHVD